MKTVVVLALTSFLWALIIVGFVVMTPERALALSDPLGFIRVYTFTCTTTAQVITPSSGKKSAKAMRIWNNSATSVFLGAADVATTVTGYPICTNTSNCETAGLPLDSAPVVWCRVAAGTVDVLVMAGL